MNFALFSEHAERVELCLVDSKTGAESARTPLPRKSDGVWHGYLPDIRPGQCYGYRIYGPNNPGAGHRYDPSKLLFDPYAKQVAPPIPTISTPIAQIAAPSHFDWTGVSPPNTPWSDTFIYETHVTSLTKLHPEVSVEYRGTFLGISQPPVIAHLKRLGVTAVQLLPVQFHFDEPALVERGLTNYWGYNTHAFFALDHRFAVRGNGSRIGDQFKQMIRELHRNGIEVLLDIVFNHTPEGNERGPTLSFRGIDNRYYYRLHPANLAEYVDVTGCGNTLDFSKRRVRDFVIDCLAYWVEEYHVDGFRFDLAAALARNSEHDVAFEGSLLEEISAHPLLGKRKLIAEPWDTGIHGYQLGAFPKPWREWNGRFRDTVRRYWQGDGDARNEFATRVTGSSDLFTRDQRTPLAGINFVTCHDGFTLHDLVSYTRKHNLANGEDNRDGTDANYSDNCGVEGPTDRADIIERRERRMRNLLTTVFLSTGVPMLRGGDELGQSQNGNNNAYCQDNPTSWIDWSAASFVAERCDEIGALIRFRKAVSYFSRQHFFSGERLEGIRMKDLTWFALHGEEMSEASWSDSSSEKSSLVMFVAPDLLVVFHPANVPAKLTFPNLRPGEQQWRALLDTAQNPRFMQGEGDQKVSRLVSDEYIVNPESIMIFQSFRRNSI